MKEGLESASGSLLFLSSASCRSFIPDSGCGRTGRADCHHGHIRRDTARRKASPGRSPDIWDGDGRAVLDRKSGNTVGDLLDDLIGKKGYTLRCEADVSAEGDYPVQVILDEGYQLVTVSEPAGAKGNTLHNGGVYTDF